MTFTAPTKVLITGGKPAGGVASFAEALRAGFVAHGIPAEVLPPRQIVTRWRDLRDPGVLKVLSTTAVLGAPFARRTICVAHGFPRGDAQGWPRLLGIFASYKLANRSSQLVAVSQYAAVHLRTIFNLRVDAVIHNPLDALFLQREDEGAHPRDYITYVGRMHPCKRLDRIFPAICALVEEIPNLRACMIGDGELRGSLEAAVRGNPRIEFKGPLAPNQVRAWLRRTRVFVSGCETEAFGIAYLEALSQGCVVAMPACGGGLEIAPEQLGKSICLLPLPLEPGEVLSALREALLSNGCTPSLAAYDAATVASSYLELDRRRNLRSLTDARGTAVHE
jgi:glycosyltransferase involved in cell wall biosynthesis